VNYGLYLSASGVLTNIYRQNVLTNNLANVHTVGFKPDVPATRQRQPEVVEKELGYEVSHQLLDRLGGGSLAGPQRVSFAQGQLQRTERTLDVALDRPDHFFAILKLGADGQQQVMLTRDGRFERGPNGTLITIAGGHPVLDHNDQSIRIPADAGPLVIDNTARIHAGGDAIAQLQVTAVSNLDRLSKKGEGLFTWQGADARRAATNVAVRQGFVETSAVDPIRALMDLVSAAKAVSANGNMIRYHDQILDRAVNVLGRVA
jgi:flagellar basal-body rod protein FlgF